LALPRPGKRVRGNPLSGLLTDVLCLKAHRHFFITESRLRQVRKHRAAAGFPPSPAFCPRMLARPGGARGFSLGVPDRHPIFAAPVVATASPPLPPVATPVLARRHSAPRVWGGGDGVPADVPASGARIGVRHRPRLDRRARCERDRFHRHSAAVSIPAGPPDISSRGGEVLLFSMHNYRIVASLVLYKLSLVPFGVVVDTGAGPNLVRRNALVPDWLLLVLTSPVHLWDANNAR